jgi:hypothetical protein
VLGMAGLTVGVLYVMLACAAPQNKTSAPAGQTPMGAGATNKQCQNDQQCPRDHICEGGRCAHIR